MSTRYLSANLFRRMPSIFHVIELKAVVSSEVEGLDDIEVEEVVDVVEKVFTIRASTFLVDLSEHESLNLWADLGYQEQLHLQRQRSHHYHS